VKPIHLNLASRPFRDYRPVYAAVVIMVIVTTLVTPPALKWSLSRRRKAL